ncbi:MAG TPA: hypothetical protein VHG08_10500 [Longimicrobium sp.]|nr:hypothetical protein [Longimicrobium sp.]
MKKLTLNLDTLEVQSFATAGAAPNRGTVHGQESQPGETCLDTCANTCFETCYASCAGPTCEGGYGCRTAAAAASCYESCASLCVD